MNLIELLEYAIKEGSSDIFIVAGLPLSFRKNGTVHQINAENLLPSDTESLLSEIYECAENRDINLLRRIGDDNFSFSITGLSRFRVSAYKQRGTYSAIIRIISFSLPDYASLHIPENVLHLGDSGKGMVLVTGPAGSGKSTTLSCIIDQINHSQRKHIITLEDPLEYLHRHAQSIVSQREISMDTESYAAALRAAMHQSPDVILLGEMADCEAIGMAINVASTGHLIFSSLRTIGATNTIDHIIDSFPVNQQEQIRTQLATVLTAIVSQLLVPTIDGKMVPAMEIMTVTPSIRNMIRDNNIRQIDSLLCASIKEDMVSMDGSLLTLYREGIISRDTALKYAINTEALAKKL